MSLNLFKTLRNENNFYSRQTRNVRHFQSFQGYIVLPNADSENNHFSFGFLFCNWEKFDRSGYTQLTNCMYVCILSFLAGKRPLDLAGKGT